MFVPRLRYRRHPRALLRRLDRAAAALNPVLAFIAIGLLLIDLIGLCSLLDQSFTSVVSWAGSPELASPPISGQADGL